MLHTEIKQKGIFLVQNKVHSKLYTRYILVGKVYPIVDFCALYDRMIYRNLTLVLLELPLFASIFGDEYNINKAYSELYNTWEVME